MVKRLKGRGVGPSKVAPAEETETIRVEDEGARDRFQTLVSDAGWSVEVGEVDGVFDTTSKTIEVTKEDGKPVKFVLDGTRTLTSGEDLSREAEMEGGRRRRSSRLQKQARRTQRNRRNRKGKQLRKLTTRRR